jgi:Domain of unknown function (DUF4184)
VPFTASHAVAALPFLRTPLPASALVIGSMTPDLPYYLPLDQGVPTHTAGAVVTYDLLLGLVAWALWHGLLAAPALAAAPAGLRGRLTRVPLGIAPRVVPVSRPAWVVTALVLAAGIHVLWDEFTHPRRWGAENIPALTEMWGPFPLHFWLQHLCGLAGAVVLLIWFVLWWRRTPAEPAGPAVGTWWVWVLLVGVGVVVGGTAAASAPSLDLAGFRGVTSGGGAVLMASVVYAVGWRIRRRDPARP